MASLWKMLLKNQQHFVMHISYFWNLLFLILPTSLFIFMNKLVKIHRALEGRIAPRCFISKGDKNIYYLKSLSSALLISRYILRLGQAAEKQQRLPCPNHKMYLEIRKADEAAFICSSNRKIHHLVIKAGSTVTLEVQDVSCDYRRGENFKTNKATFIALYRKDTDLLDKINPKYFIRLE